jgi:hypothetical protein
MNINNLKIFLKKKLPSYILVLCLSVINKKYHLNWLISGKPVPPPHVVKQKIVSEYAQHFKLSTLVETGTYLGDMIFAQRKNFGRIITVELNPSFYEDAKKRFNKDKNVEIIQGDSGKVLRMLTEKKVFDNPCLFWLDSHYSGLNTSQGEKATPILEELHAILSTGQNHIILIDDARSFVGENDYPTIGELKTFITERVPKSIFIVADDIIRIEIIK